MGRELDTQQKEDTNTSVVEQPGKVIAVKKFDVEIVHVNNYIAGSKDSAKLNACLNKHSVFANQKITELANVGLSIANGDYYIVPYGDRPTFPIDYKGMLKVAAMEAKKNGFQLVAKADTLRDGFARADVSTNGLIDNVVIENGKINGDIVTAYAILTLIDMQTRQTVMQKVEILPIKEFENAVSKSKMSSGGPHKEFKTEMAKKTALRRGVKLLNTMFASDVLDKLFSIDDDSYSLSKQQSQTQHKSIEDLTPKEGQ